MLCLKVLVVAEPGVAIFPAEAPNIEDPVPAIVAFALGVVRLVANRPKRLDLRTARIDAVACVIQEHNLPLVKFLFDKVAEPTRKAFAAQIERLDILVLARIVVPCPVRPCVLLRSGHDEALLAALKKPATVAAGHKASDSLYDRHYLYFDGS